MHLVVISTPNRVPREHAQLDRLFRAGLSVFHVRKPEWTEEQVERYIERIDERWRGRCMLHGRPIAAAHLGLKGAHYTERTRPQPPLRAVGGQEVSTSFHSLDQLGQPWGPALSYAFLSPVFDSISKPGHMAAKFDRWQLEAALTACPFPVMALGGVTAENIDRARAMGFDGIAVIGSVWEADEPAEAFMRLQDMCKRRSGHND